ncbi:MAG: AsmA-like C-terminal region-containing protein [Nitrospinaceae bacterium]|nr:AsmA-like C-terminal region-containing protein [Nitrospinaceae bacterium]
MKILFNKKIAVYFFSGFLICCLAIAGFVYGQLKDLDNIKAMAVEKMEELTGRNVSIGAADLEFVKGISIRLRNVFINSSNGENRQFSAKSAWFVVELWPLLNKKIEIQKFIVEGASIELVRNEKGQFNVGNPSRWLAEPAQSGLFKVLAASFMHRLSLSDGEVRFLDYYNVPGPDPFSITVKNINLTVNKQFLQKPFSFDLSGEIPNAHKPTAFQVSGSFDNLGGENEGKPIPIKGKVKVDQLHVPQFRSYFKKVFLVAPEDSWLSLESEFSGNLGGNLRSEGKLRYTTTVMDKRPVLRSMDSHKRGVMDYSIVLDKDSIEIQDFKLRSGSMKFSAKGKVAEFLSQDPKVSFAIQTGEFKIAETRQYLPLMFFPESVHRDLNRRFDNGTLEVKSLKFDGSLAQLQKLESKENKNLLAAEIILRQVDWRSPLPPLKKVTGSLKYQNGDGSFKILTARYKDFPIANVKGTVRNVMNNPVADLSVENELTLEKLNRALKNALAGESFENILDDYQNFSGKGLLKVNIQGPLEEPDKISITGALTMKNASFYEAELKLRVKNFNGELLYHHVPKEKQKPSKASAPIVAFKNLSGEFGKSSFSNMQGEILRQEESTVRKMKAVYRLNAAELPGVIADIDFSGPLFTVLKQAEFGEGDVEVNYRNFIDFNHPEQEKDWGKIELKNVSVKHPSGFQPLLKLTGGISFGDGRIALTKVGGWYGNSLIQVDGQLVPKSGSLVDFDLSATSADWTQDDLKDIPYLQDLKFSGPLSSVITLTGDRNSFKFKSKLNLTQTSYKFQDEVYKKENIPNLMEMGGAYSPKEGIVVDHLKIVLDDSTVTGKAKIKSLVDPEYSIKLSTSGLRTNTMASVVAVLKNNRDGEIDFDISGRGNLNNVEDSWVEGSAVLKNLVFKSEDRVSPITFSADVRFSGNAYDVRSGQLASGHSKLAFSGVCKNGEHPELVLKLTGKTLIVDELIPPDTDDNGVEINFRDLLEKSRLISKGTSKVSVDLEQLSYKWMTLSDVSGKIFLKDREIIFDGFQVGSKNPIKGRGKFSVKDPEAIRFETQLEANDIEAGELLAMFGDHFKDGLTGRVKKLDLSVKSRGRNLSESIRTLSGKASIRLDKGTIDKRKLKAGTFSLFGLQVPVADKNNAEVDEGPSNYVGISGDFTHVGGIAETENFIYETDQRRTSIVGKFDLNKREMDTVVGVAPMPGLDKFLTKIPVVGKILTAGDEGSLIKTYYTVKGPFDDPEVSATPFTSLGKKVMGLFQGILQTPGEILTLPAKIGAEKATN